MQHVDIRLGNTRYLLCDPQTTASGKPAAYGAFLRSVDQAVRSAAALNAVLFLIRPPKPINAAIYDLDSPDVRIIGQSGWNARLLRMVWWAATPVRYGSPLAWFVSGAALRARSVTEAVKGWTRRQGWRQVDRVLDRCGHTCRLVSNRYEKRAAAAWRALCAEGRARARATDSKRHRVRLRLRRDAQAAVDRLAQAAGLDPARPMVLLHARESGYRQRPAERQQQLDRLRDARIETYGPAVMWMVERGYQVIRIGDATMTPCPWPDVVDLAKAPWRIDAFELWVALNSRFFVCGDSGPYLLALLGGVPCVSVNTFRLGYNTVGAKDLYIAKRVFDRAQDRFLSVAEQLEEKFVHGPIDVDRYEWTDNTPDDIREAVEDMVAALDDPGVSRTPAQRRHDELLSQLTVPRGPDGRAQPSLLARKGGRGALSPSFAARYFDSAPADRLEQGPRMR